MIAIKRLQSIMWILVIALGALAAYLISLRVATERNAVHETIDQIRHTRSEIRYLEAEYGARANMLQLANWNSSDLQLRVPAPSQYLPSERALAQLDRIEPAAPAAAPAPPVMTAMADAAPSPPADAQVRASDFALIRSASAAEPPVPARRAGRLLVDTPPAAPPRAAAQDPEARRAARLAMLDARLLGGSADGAAPRAAPRTTLREAGASRRSGKGN